jgi:hypothetical protein
MKMPRTLAILAYIGSRRFRPPMIYCPAID